MIDVTTAQETINHTLIMAQSAGDQTFVLAQGGGGLDIPKLPESVVRFFRSISWIGLFIGLVMICGSLFLPSKDGGRGNRNRGKSFVFAMVAAFMFYDLNNLIQLTALCMQATVGLGGYFSNDVFSTDLFSDTKVSVGNGTIG